MDAEQEFNTTRAGLKSIFESIRSCGHQGIPLRGHRYENVTSNFNCLPALVGKFNPDVEKSLGSENKVKFLSHQILNKVLRDLAHTLLRGLLDRIREESIGVNKKESVFSIILDETSDINRNEQVSVSVRFCNTEMNSEEVFLGFNMTKRTTADALLSLIKSSLTAFNLPFSGIRGQGYDDASNMSGRNSGFQSKVASENDMALYLYCFGHQLNLVVQDSLVALPEVAIALERMNGVVTFIRNSPKKMGRFKEILEVSEQENEASNFTYDNLSKRPLCLTRWVMRLPAVDAFLSHYSSIIDFLVDIKEDRTEPVKNKGEVDSFLRSLETFQDYFCLRVVQKILQIVQPVHVMCQGPKSTAGDVRGWVNTLALTLTAEGSNVENLTVPRRKTADHITTFYAVLYQTVAREAAKALCDRYSTNDLEIVDLLRRSLQDPTLTMAELTKVATDISLDAVWQERNNWFERCSLLGDVPSIKTLREKHAKEDTWKFMMPNFHMLCDICLYTSFYM